MFLLLSNIIWSEDASKSSAEDGARVSTSRSEEPRAKGAASRSELISKACSWPGAHTLKQHFDLAKSKSSGGDSNRSSAMTVDDLKEDNSEDEELADIAIKLVQDSARHGVVQNNAFELLYASPRSLNGEAEALL